jgi:hypothetical protein
MRQKRKCKRAATEEQFEVKVEGTKLHKRYMHIQTDDKRVVKTEKYSSSVIVKLGWKSRRVMVPMFTFNTIDILVGIIVTV